jgi:CHAT domain-containing protein
MILSQGLTQKITHGQILIAETPEIENNLCDSPAPDISTNPLFQRYNSQLREAQHLIQEIKQLYQQGLYANAIPIAEYVLSIYQNTIGKNTLEFAKTLHLLASLNHTVNNIQKAEIYLQKAIKIRIDILGENHTVVAQSRRLLADNYRMQKKYSESEYIYQQVLEIYQRNCGENHILVLGTFNNLSHLYMNQKRYQEAASILKKALENYNNLSEEDRKANSELLSPTENSLLNNLAAAYSLQKKYQQAILTYLKVIENYRNEQKNEHPKLAIYLNNLAFSQLAVGEIEQSLTSLTQGMDIEERNLRLTLAIGSEEDKQAYMNTLTDTTNRAISLHLQNAPNNKTAANLALTTILRRKGRILDVMANSLGILRKHLTLEQQNLLHQLEVYRRQIAMLKFNPVPDTNPNTIEALETKEKQIEAKLLQYSAEFRAEAQQIEIQDIQQLIPANTALIEFVSYQSVNVDATPGQFWGERRYAAYILTADGQIQWVDLGEDEPINSLINTFIYVIDWEPNIHNIKKSARNLDEKLMQPIRQKLSQNIRHILLAPDGFLNKVPFAALVDENDQFLVENYTITYLTSGRDLLRLQINASAQQPAVIIANPSYQDEGDPNSRNVMIQTRNSNRVARGMRSTYEPLPGTEAEAQALRELLPDAIVLTDSQATENAVKAARSPEILHLATHGFFLPSHSENQQENPLLRSGLILAGYDQRSSGDEDGILTALEVASLNLRGTQLVVLSACETGVGDISNGEGVYGLRRAFVIAGARSQLSSLWEVDDWATKELMKKYYQRLIKGEGISEALRQTQLEMLQNPDYQDPYFWAAFIPSGDWTSISLAGSKMSQFESE